VSKINASQIVKRVIKDPFLTLIVPLNVYANVSPVVKENKLYFKVQITKNYLRLFFVELVPISMFVVLVLMTLKSFAFATRRKDPKDVETFNNIISILILASIVLIFVFLAFMIPSLWWSFTTFLVFMTIFIIGLFDDESAGRKVIGEKTLSIISLVLTILFLSFTGIYFSYIL